MTLNNPHTSLTENVEIWEIWNLTESSKYYARLQTAVASGLVWLARRLTGHHTATAPKHSLCFSVTVIPVIL